jgi:hypothetical protein
MKALSLLALAAMGIAGVAQAQTTTYGAGSTGQAPAAQPMQPSGQMQTMPSGQGQAVQSGGQMQYGGQMQSGGTMNQSMPSQAMAPTGPEGTFKDEYGFRYNSRGDRIDARGRILPPPVTPPGARALK